MVLAEPEGMLKKEQTIKPPQTGPGSTLLCQRSGLFLHCGGESNLSYSSGEYLADTVSSTLMNHTE